MENREIELLEKHGWIVECESPLELYNEESNSVATNEAARIVIRDCIKSEYGAAKEFLQKKYPYLGMVNKIENEIIDFEFNDLVHLLEEFDNQSN